MSKLGNKKDPLTEMLPKEYRPYVFILSEGEKYSSDAMDYSVTLLNNWAQTALPSPKGSSHAKPPQAPYCYYLQQGLGKEEKGSSS